MVRRDESECWLAAFGRSWSLNKAVLFCATSLTASARKSACAFGGDD